MRPAKSDAGRHITESGKPILNPGFCIKAFALVLAGALAGPVFAQGLADSYPTKPVTLIVPYSAGGNTELEARLYAQRLGESLGRPVVLDFKPGAGTTVGTAYVAKAPPDGHTLLTISSAFATAPAFYKDLPYDPVKDIAPISLMNKRTIVFLLHPSLPFKNIAEYVAFARANPGAINFATSGAGGATHLGGAQLGMATTTEVTFVHYKGAAQMATDLVAGRVNATFNALSTSLPQIRSGKLKVLAISSIERSPLLPGMQTIAEQGVPGFDYSSYMGIVAPGGTPVGIINRLSLELQKIAKSPEVIQRLAADGSLTVGSTPEQLRQFYLAEINQFRILVQKTGIQLQE